MILLIVLIAAIAAVDIFITVAVHELGHLLAGYAVGLRLNSIRISIFQLDFPKHWSTRFVPLLPLSGVTVMQLGKFSEQHLLLRYIIFVMCGPLANFVFAGLVLFLVEDQRGIKMELGALLAVLNLLFFAMNLIPATNNQLDTDGRILSQLLFNKKDRDLRLARFTFSARMREFRSQFTQGNSIKAQEQLRWMELACEGLQGHTLRPIVSHLHEHLVSGESMENCRWWAMICERGVV